MGFNRTLLPFSFLYGHRDFPSFGIHTLQLPLPFRPTTLNPFPDFFPQIHQQSSTALLGRPVSYKAVLLSPPLPPTFFSSSSSSSSSATFYSHLPSRFHRHHHHPFCLPATDLHRPLHPPPPPVSIQLSTRSFSSQTTNLSASFLQALWWWTSNPPSPNHKPQPHATSVPYLSPHLLLFLPLTSLPLLLAASIPSTYIRVQSLPILPAGQVVRLRHHSSFESQQPPPQEPTCQAKSPEWQRQIPRSAHLLSVTIGPQHSTVSSVGNFDE